MGIVSSTRYIGWRMHMRLFAEYFRNFAMENGFNFMKMQKCDVF